jgi:hypothetical protein
MLFQRKLSGRGSEVRSTQTNKKQSSINWAFSSRKEARAEYQLVEKILQICLSCIYEPTRTIPYLRSLLVVNQNNLSCEKKDVFCSAYLLVHFFYWSISQ